MLENNDDKIKSGYKTDQVHVMIFTFILTYFET
jgi:hypothetical protein